jgi:tRNA (Thr-GGU) A37 N-methylase
MLTFTMHPIGLIRSPRTEPIDDDWGAVVSRVALDTEQFTAGSLRGLEHFSHIDVVYVFDRVDQGSFERAARRPRNNPDWPAVGVFAQRNKRRPNRIGVSTCELNATPALQSTSVPYHSTSPRADRRPTQNKPVSARTGSMITPMTGRRGPDTVLATTIAQANGASNRSPPSRPTPDRHKET